jgi:hypothetical protein
MQRPRGTACVAPIHSLQRKNEAQVRSWARGRLHGFARPRGPTSERVPSGAHALHVWCVRSRGRRRENRGADSWAPCVGERKERKEDNNLLG